MIYFLASLINACSSRQYAASASAYIFAHSSSAIFWSLRHPSSKVVRLPAISAESNPFPSG